MSLKLFFQMIIQDCSCVDILWMDGVNTNSYLKARLQVKACIHNINDASHNR